MFPKNLLSLAVGAVGAGPLIRDTSKATLKFSTKINITGFGSLVGKDRARIQALKQLPHLNEHSDSKRSVAAVNSAMFYTAEVGIGTPPIYHTLLIDTGSANTWGGASGKYVPTSSSVNARGQFDVTYGPATVYGEEWRDIPTLTSDLVIHQQSMGVASWAGGVDGFDGILDLGPANLTMGTVSDAFTVPTVMDNPYTQKKIPQPVLVIFFSPASESNSNGALTFGGYDNSATTSTVNYVPLTTLSPSSELWGIDQSISYGHITILPLTAGIVDTGTTLILIATDAFQLYKSLTGATTDHITGLLTINASRYENLQTLTFNIGGSPITLLRMRRFGHAR